MMSSTASLPSPHPSVLFQPVSEGAVLLHVDDEVYFGLNEVGCEIWQLLPPRSASLAELVAALGAKYPDVPEATLVADVSELLGALEKAGLVRTT